MSSSLTLKQALFLEHYLTSGDAKAAFVHAGYKGVPETGGDLILKRPAVKAALARVSEASVQAMVDSSVDAVKAQVKDRLQTREGLCEWLVTMIRGEIEVDKRDRNGEPYSAAPSFSDRLAAATLLSKISGFMAPIKIEGDVKQDVTHFHTMDNGRGVAIPASVKLVK